MEPESSKKGPRLDKAKYKQLILYILNSIANNPNLGKVKLFTMLYFIDFQHFEVYKASITGDVYRKKEFGPVPEHGDQLLSEMASGEWITIDDVQRFTRSEIEIIDQEIQKWAMHTTREIVSASHGDLPWRAVGMGEEIPYTLAFYRSQALVPNAIS